MNSRIVTWFLRLLIASPLVIVVHLAMVALAALVACSDLQPTPIDYGSAQCTSCKMTITDKQYGSEIVTTTGKTYAFDAVECMLSWYASEGVVKMNQVHSLWVSDHAHPGTLIDAKSACYVASEELHSPMGLNVAAFSSSADCDAAVTTYSGTKHTYTTVLEMAKEH
jgi:copper chaperone NosL